MSVVAGVYGVKADGSVKGLGIGFGSKILEKYRSENPQEFVKIKYFDTNGRKKQRKVVKSIAKPKPKAKAKDGNSN